MPSIKAIFGADASELYRVVSSGIPNAMRGLRQQMDSLFGGGKNRSTIFNVTQEKDAVREYGEWWSKTLTSQSIEAATRANRARQLIRQRHAAQERAAAVADQIALDNAVEAASRSNRARALLRERRQARVDSWRERTEAMRSGPGSFQTGGVAVGAMAGGNWRSRIGVAGSMFTSVARDSAASLASGAPITQVIAQQAPQVLQALAMMKLSTIAWGAALAGVAVYGWHKITEGISNAVYKVDELSRKAENLAGVTDSIRRGRRLGDLYDQNINDAQSARLQNESDAIDRRQRADAAKREKENLDFEATGADPEKLRKFKLANERGRLFSVLKDEEEKKRLRATQLDNERQNALIEAQHINGPQTDEEMIQQNFKIEAIKAEYDRKKQNLDAESKITIDELNNQIQRTDNEIKFGGPKDAKTTAPRGGQRAGGMAITEWERAGGFMAGPQVALLDVAKAQLKSSQRIEKLLSKTTLKAGHSGVKY